MAFVLNCNDLDLLVTIADYRILPIHQLAALHQRRVRPLRRRLNSLEKQKLIRFDIQGLGKKRGRPERLISLSEAGIRMLKKEGVLGKDVTVEFVAARNISNLEHHLCTNTFRVQLVQLERIAPRMKVRFISETSPFQERRADGRTVIHERIPDDGGEVGVGGFVPDGVFSITDEEKGKTLLFFLEVDMATETLASPRNKPYDLRHKVLNYQALFCTRRYKRYENVWSCRLKGFRVLFLSYTSHRKVSICRLVKDMPPSGFIWLTDRGSLLSEGVWAKIWTQGGRLGMPLQSILGSQLLDSSPTPFTII